MTTTINDKLARRYAPGMPMDEPTFVHDYGDYLADLCEPLTQMFGTTFTLTQTGGWCMALVATLEGGDYLLVTDARDTLSPMPIRRRCYKNDREILGFSVGYYPRDCDLDDGWPWNDGHRGDDMIAYVRFRKARDAQAVGIAVRACITLAGQVRSGLKDWGTELEL